MHRGVSSSIANALVTIDGTQFAVKISGFDVPRQLDGHTTFNLNPLVL